MLQRSGLFLDLDKFWQIPKIDSDKSQKAIHENQVTSSTWSGPLKLTCICNVGVEWLNSNVSIVVSSKHFPCGPSTRLNTLFSSHFFMLPRDWKVAQSEDLQRQGAWPTLRRHFQKSVLYRYYIQRIKSPYCACSTSERYTIIQRASVIFLHRVEVLARKCGGTRTEAKFIVMDSVSLKNVYIDVASISWDWCLKQIK